MTALFQSWGASYEWAWFWSMVIGILVIALPLMLAVAMIIYAERKIWAAMALRRGPNVVGPWGVLQSFADGLKVFLKETIVPSAANKGLFLLAPIISFTVALIVWAVIPFQAGVVLADVNVGLLYILAASSLGVYGVIVAGFQTEYSSMSFALFWLGEYGNVILMCALNAILFWGGWLPPLNVDLIPWFDIPGILWLFVKMSFFFFVFSWVRATVPRYRYDQLMRLGWKIFLPLSLVFVFLVSGWLMLTRYGGGA
jgi:NADH:ubiquinone oxidoreductase subunit H